MSPSEESALDGLLREHFQLKAALAHERQCIDRAVNRLNDLLPILGSPRSDKLEALAAITDDVRRFLVEVRLELERIRDSMTAAGAVPVTSGVNGTAGT